MSAYDMTVFSFNLASISNGVRVSLIGRIGEPFSDTTFPSIITGVSRLMVCNKIGFSLGAKFGVSLTESLRLVLLFLMEESL